MKNSIELNGIKLYGYHGCLPEETKIGGHYVIDVALDTNFLKAAINDDLKNTIDYVEVNRIVTEEMKIPSKLIENVGYRIVERIKKELEGVEKIAVKISKITPPINGDVKNVAIIIID